MKNNTFFEKNCSIEIFPVENGFIIRPTREYSKDSPPIEATLAFQSFTSMTDWLEDYFSYRKYGVVSDELL